MSESMRIESAAVIGAGVMGAAIAAHLANAGIATLLLDIKPDKPSDAESTKGLTRDDPKVANRIVQSGFQAALKARPPAFFSRHEPALVTLGNLEDDLERLQEADWIVEAVIENLDIKKKVFEAIAPFVAEHAVVSTNTSGLSVAAISGALPASLRSRFLVTHFFNPPRYLHLLEMVPGPDTDPGLFQSMGRFAEDRLGKGVVRAKDTPNFIANRVGVFSMMDAVRLMGDKGLTINAVDALTGPAIGRPKSATFRTADLVGLDTLVYVADGMAERLPDDPQQDVLRAPPLLTEMVKKGLIGQKVGKGFYQRVKEKGKSVILMIDPQSFEYVPQPKLELPSLGAARKIPDTGKRIQTLVNMDDVGGQYLWTNLSATLQYAASCIPEISDDIMSVDDAMRWGFGWELGPFQMWDAIGVEEAAKRIQADGYALPPVVEAVLAKGGGSFYQREKGEVRYFDISSERHMAVPAHPRQLSLVSLKDAGRVVIGNDDATLVDLGDDVVCLEFHTKMNTVSPGIINMMNESLDEVERRFRGLVVGNEAPDFCAGANLALILEAITKGDAGTVETIVRDFQAINQRLQCSQRPVVVAPRGRVLGGGCEITLGGDRVCAAAESYIGLVEVGVGVIPAGGGTKEMMKRAEERIPHDVEMDLFPIYRRVFETIGMARVSASAVDAIDVGFLRPTDHVTMNGDQLLWEAKRVVMALDLEGYRPRRPRTDIRVMGRPGLAVFQSALYNFAEGRQVTEYDAVVGEALAWVISGGDLTGPARVSEDYLLNLELQAFMRLCQDERTQARMAHLLETGKPLRN